MPAEMTITHETGGVYTFPQEKIPLMTRRITAERIHPQSGGHRRIDVTLSGYFNGYHTDILAQYSELADYLNGQRVKLYYHDGTQVVVNNQEIYFDQQSEPEQWKQRLGDYSFSGYYFLMFDPSFKGLSMSFSSPAGSYSFTQLPVLGINKDRERPSPNSYETFPSGAAIGGAVSLSITGEVCGATHSALLAEKADLETAFSRDGTLNYGDLSYACHVNRVQWQPTVPLNYWPYTIDLTYFLPGLINFNAEIDYERLTYNPIIHENPACANPPIVISRFPTGQHISYSFQGESTTIAGARSLLLNEINALVYPGGVEIKGGSERHNVMSTRVNVNFTKYYATPVLANLG